MNSGSTENEGTAPGEPPVDVAPQGLEALRRTPHLILEAGRLVRRAAPRQAVLSGLLQVTSAAIVGLQLVLAKEVVVQLVQNHRGVNAWGVAPMLAALIGATAASNAIAAGLTLQQRLMTDLVTYHTIDQIIRVATDVDYAQYEDPTFHDQLERARNASMYRPIEIVTGVTTLLTAVVTSAGIAIALLTLEPLLVPIVIVGGIPILLVALQNSRHTYAFQHAMTPHAREQLHLLEVMTSPEYAKEIRVTGAHKPLRRRYELLTELRVTRFRRFLRERLLASLLAAGISALAAAAALGAIVWLIETHRTSLATAAAALVAMQLLASRMQAMTTSLGRIVEAGMFLDDYASFLELAEAHIEPADPVAPTEAPTFRGLQVRELSFRYPGTDRMVLDGVSLDLQPGEIVALVGMNGSGKTTLVKLLCALYRELEGGRILWDGVDASLLRTETIRRQISVLFQDFARYELSVADNIGLGRSDVPPERSDVEEAARRAGAEPMIRRLSRGFDTRLGRRFEGGTELSGGQWQRLALARAFYRGGTLLVLDEPTAALDPKAEYELFEQVRELAQGKSVLLISHRFSSVRMADRIYVLEQGRIVEHGTHQELMAVPGAYAELYELQAAAYFGHAAAAGPSTRGELE